MKKLSRLVYYLSFVLVFVISLCLTNNYLSAYSNDSNYIYYDYNDDYIINTVNKDFFGANGYLEKLRNISAFQGYKSILFSDNDIFYFRGDYNYNLSGFMYNFYYDSKSKVTHLQIQNRAGDWTGFKKLSDYDSFDDFYIAVQNSSGWQKLDTFELTSKHSKSKLGVDYNYFDTSSEYLIPYYLHTYKGNATVFYTRKNYPDYQENLPVIGNVTASSSSTTFPTYYELYGYNFPNKQSSMTTLISLDTRVDIKNIDNFSATFTFKSLTEARIQGFLALGLKNDNGLYHWEKINVSSDVQFLPDYDDLKCNNGTCTVTFKNGYNVGLEQYEAIYFKHLLANAHDTYGFTSNTDNAINYFNDLYQDGIIDEIDLNATHTTIFSTPLDVYPGYFWYEILTSNEDVQGEHYYGRYNEISLIDTTTLKSKANSSLYLREYTSPYNGKFHRLDYGSFGQTDNTVIYTYLRNSDTGFNKKIKYVYKPIDDNGESIIYINYSPINDDRLGSSIIVVDNNRNPVDLNVNVDFGETDDFSLLNTIFNNLLNLFLPTGQELQDFLVLFDGVLSRKLGFIWEIFELPVTFISKVVSYTPADLSCLKVPKIVEPLTGYKLIDEQTLCFSIYREKWSVFFDISDFIISAVCTIAFVSMVRTKIKKVFLGGVFE